MDLMQLIRKYATCDRDGTTTVSSKVFYDIDTWNLITDPARIDFLGDELAKKVKDERYGAITGIGDEGLALASALALKLNLGVSTVNPYAGWCPPYGMFTKSGGLPELAGVKGQDVLLVDDVIGHCHWQAYSVKAVIDHGGNPRTLLALVDFDNHPSRKGNDVKQAILEEFVFYKEPQPVMDLVNSLEIKSLLKSSELV